MEASFLVSEDALKRIQPDMFFDEAGLLRAFDFNRELSNGSFTLAENLSPFAAPGTYHIT